MIGYANYKDSWSIKQQKSNIKKPLKENFKTNDNQCKIIEHLKSCKKCLEKFKSLINEETDKKIEYFKSNNNQTKNIQIEGFNNIMINDLFNNINSFMKNNKQITLVILFSLFIILSFLLVRNENVSNIDTTSNIEALRSANDMSTLLKNYILVPKNNFEHLINPN
jgi:hypothetical protein